MEENERVLSGLTAALKSGYKYFYVPVPDDFSYSIIYARVKNIAREIGVEVKVRSRIILNGDSKTYSKIAIIEVLGIDDKYVKREFDKQERKKADLEKKVGLIRELRDKGYNYREIANKLHYKSSASILYILRKALKYGL